MSESAIEKELLEATGLKPKKNENRQEYLARLCRAGAKLPDDVWEGVTKPAQDWNNDAAISLKEGKSIVDFPDMEEEGDPTDDEIDAEEPAPKAKKAKANGHKEAKPEKEKLPPHPASVRKVSACHTIKKMVVKKPTITVAELSEKLKEDGLKVSDVTIATLRSDCRDTLRVLNEVGSGNFVL